MTQKPKRWIAALLGLVGGPLGLLYAGRPAMAFGYGVILVALATFTLLVAVPAVSVVSMAMTIVGAYLAQRAAGSWPEGRVRPWYSRWYGLSVVAASALVAIVGARAFLIEPFRVPSGAMLPTIDLGSPILVQKWGYGHYSAYGIMLARRLPSRTLVRGELFVFDAPKLKDVQYIKRLIGLPGDVVVYDDRRLQINGQPLSYEDRPPYFDTVASKTVERRSERIDSGAHDILVDARRPALPTKDMLALGCLVESPGRLVCRVPEGHVFMMGDNRDNSMDSRYLGPVPLASIVGKVVHVAAP